MKPEGPLSQPGLSTTYLENVYVELKEIARRYLSRERPGQTLSATGLVHEAYMKLVDQGDWIDRDHFVSIAAISMQRVLVDVARRKNSLRRGGSNKRVELNLDAFPVSRTDEEDFRELRDAIEMLAELYPQKAHVVKLRFFAGMSVSEAAKILGVARCTAHRHWLFAKSWLYELLVEDQCEDPVRSAPDS